jgi:hypothetical protein
VLYRNDELDSATTDCNWPHQVALPAYRCHGHNYLTMRLFCEALSLYPRTHSLRHDDQHKIVFSFAKHAHAEKFRERFGGEFMAHTTRRSSPRPHTRLTDFSAEQRVRYGRCINCAD